MRGVEAGWLCFHIYPIRVPRLKTVHEVLLKFPDVSFGIRVTSPGTVVEIRFLL